MNDFLKAKKLLVVGGTSGMGLETARQFLKAGGGVVLTGSKQDKADAVHAELSPAGERISDRCQPHDRGRDESCTQRNQCQPQ